jgi:type VI secretion system protein VasJ
MRELVSRVPEPDAPAPVSEPQALETASADNTTSATRAPVVSGSSEINSRSDVESILLRVSTFIKASDPQDALGYRLPRIVDFGDLTSEPPDDGGKLMIPGPEASGLSAMRSLRAASDWLGLVETADNVCRSSPLCLDAHRYCSEGLSALGGPFQAASDGIRDEVRSLLKRAPRLIRLQFSDGTPLADPETQEWLKDEASSPAPTSASVESEIDPEELEKARAEAKDLAKKGDLPAALARLAGTLAADASPRGRFLGRLELAELCVGAGHDRVALPMLSDLDDTLLKHGLEAWEPALSRRLLELYYQCRKRLAANDVEVEEALARAEKLYDRLCRVDPVAAAALV